MGRIRLRAVSRRDRSARGDGAHRGRGPRGGRASESVAVHGGGRTVFVRAGRHRVVRDDERRRRRRRRRPRPARRRSVLRRRVQLQDRVPVRDAVAARERAVRGGHDVHDTRVRVLERRARVRERLQRRRGVFTDDDARVSLRPGVLRSRVLRLPGGDPAGRRRRDRGRVRAGGALRVSVRGRPGGREVFGREPHLSAASGERAEGLRATRGHTRALRLYPRRGVRVRGRVRRV
mmetsp:Transcript_2884/g.9399  ORF Transcript_2884/g.9399 Transcript_2884/m.9399 type:complete len:234 (+) Transcript_2884:272-973(+)